MNDTSTDVRNRLTRRWTALRGERSYWFSYWQDICEVLLPTSGRFFVTDKKRVSRRNYIYDPTGTQALKILAGGMMSGATSPARPWFRLAAADTDLNDYQPVKVWLAEVTERMSRVFRDSNTYDALERIYMELGAYGTAASIIEPVAGRSIIRHYPLTIGEYCIGVDAQGAPDTLYREFQMSAGMLVEKFGEENCSTSVRSLVKSNRDAWVTVLHGIERRTNADPERRDAKNMPWGSWYVERDNGDQTVLRESGYRTFPAVCPRWDVRSGDVYGTSPAMDCFGQLDKLQNREVQKAKAIDYQIEPPVAVPYQIKNTPSRFKPGGVYYVDSGTQANTAVRSMWDVQLNLEHLEAEISDTREMVQRTFFVDVFQMMQGLQDGTMTAAEVAVRNEEKMMRLGPVLERLNSELFSPLIETTFAHMVEAGEIPPPPKEMAGQALNIEYVSMLAQAQQAIGMNSMTRFLGTVSELAQFKPEALDWIDVGAAVNVAADRLGVDPKLVLPPERVQQIQQARAQAQQAQAQAQAMQQAAVAARNLSGAQTGGGSNALQDLLNQYSGYGSPSGAELGR